MPKTNIKNWEFRRFLNFSGYKRSAEAASQILGWSASSLTMHTLVVIHGRYTLHIF